MRNFLISFIILVCAAAGSAQNLPLEHRLATMAHLSGLNQDLVALDQIQALGNSIFLAPGAHTVYYPNGRLARYGNALYYPNGQRATDGPGVLFYPSGRLAFYDQIAYHPNGRVAFNPAGSGVAYLPPLATPYPVAPVAPAALSEAAHSTLVARLRRQDLDSMRVDLLREADGHFTSAQAAQILDTFAYDRQRETAWRFLANRLVDPAEAELAIAEFSTDGWQQKARDYLLALH